MDANAILQGLKSITDSLSDNGAAVEAIRAIEHLQMRPDAKVCAISSVIEKTEHTKEEAFKHLSAICQTMMEVEAESPDKKKR